MSLSAFREIVLADFEFEVSPGERPVPVCLVAKELRSNRTCRVFQSEFGAAPPYAAGPDVLFVAFYASAELGCYLSLGWQMPDRILDLFTEFRNHTNGRSTPAGAGLLGALTFFGLDGMGATTKKEIQEAIGSGAWAGQYTADEVLDYCESDVLSLARLLPAMLPVVDLPRALLRGRYMASAATIEHAGVPIDTTTLHLLRDKWVSIQDRLIAGIDSQYHVYEGRTFKQERFAKFLENRRIPWPRLGSGALDLGDDTFRQMAKAHPEISALRELRSALSELRLNDLAVGRDGRNRTMLSAFRSRSGRNQPSNAKFIFGPSVWLRGLIKPPPGYAVAYIDWSQQEFGIAGALSGDTAMMEAYASGDPYLTFAKQARAVPADATKASHRNERELYKQCVLATQYGMGAESLAARIGQPPIVARDLLRMHRETYSRFWNWSDASLDHAMLHGSLHTVFGWRVHVGEISNPRSLRNFPMQANGAEMLRLACCLGVERGIQICAPVHDAVLICAPEQDVDADVETMRAAMAEASRIVLGGFELGTDVKVTRWPDRYADERGAIMWSRVMGLIGEDSRTWELPNEQG
jgi:DNA polymerase family A